MLRKKFFIFFVMSLIIVSVTGLFPGVPPAGTHQPDVPFFLESMNFQTMQMHIFPEHISGMVSDPYSDLIWNPAYILRQSKKSLYLDFGVKDKFSFPMINDFSLYKNYYSYYPTSLVLPSWYMSSSPSAVSTSPLYRFAAIIPLSAKITIGFTNRSIIDYGSFRSVPNYWDDIYDRFDPYAEIGLKPQRLEVDENQRTVFGNQSEITLGYKLSKKIDLGLRLGYYTYSNDGNLYDSKEGVYPHFSFTNLDDETDKISGHHFEAGIGLLFHLGTKTRLGLYGGFTTGKCTEDISALDTKESWSERDVNPDYYNINQYSMNSSESYSGDGKKPKFSLTFEHDFSKKLLFRSFLSYTKSSIDTSGSTISINTGAVDRTYDYYHAEDFHFRRYEYNSDGESGLSGSGEKRTNSWKWFASLTYKPNKTWGIFSGVQIQRYTFEQEIDETSHYMSASRTKYSIFEPESKKYQHSANKNYLLTGNYERLSLFLPVGLKIKAVKRLFFILGADLALTFSEQSLQGEILYPGIVTRKWQNGKLIVDDREVNRYEEYSSDPAKVLIKTLSQRFGIVYEHPAGVKVYLGSYGNIFHTDNWSFGFEMNW